MVAARAPRGRIIFPAPQSESVLRSGRNCRYAGNKRGGGASLHLALEGLTLGVDGDVHLPPPPPQSSGREPLVIAPAVTGDGGSGERLCFLAQ
jgi:hypothetical protein